MDFADFIADRAPILLDGAMGTQLGAIGLDMGGQSNISNPDDVLFIHKTYSEIGCNILITNTLTMNRIYLLRYPAGIYELHPQPKFL